MIEYCYITVTERTVCSVKGKWASRDSTSLRIV